MSVLISKVLIIITVLVSFIIPGDVNGAVLTVDNEVKSTEAVIEYTYENKTGYVIANECWVEKLEYKLGENWVNVPVEDEIEETAFYVNPGATHSSSFDAGLLMPGATYRITIGYNVITAFDGATEEGFATTEFEVAGLFD